MRTCFLIIIFLQSLAGSSQAILQGRIWDDTAAIQGLTVTVGKQTAVSDSSGHFRFHLLPGKYVMMITGTGYAPYRQSIQLRDSLSLSVLMERQIREMDAVVVSGTMRAVKKLDSPIPVEVYQSSFFKKNPAPTLFESLQHINGLRPQLNCSVCNTGDIHMNGLEGPYTMVTIDGMPIVSSLSSVYGLFGIPSALIDRIEIVKGPASGLYGSEAIGGLINIITRSADDKKEFTARVFSTSWMEHSADLGVKWKLSKKISMLTGLHYFRYQKPIDKNHDGFTDVTLQHRGSLFNKWSLSRPADRVATLAARLFYEDRWGGEMNWTSKYRGTDLIYGESIRTARWELIGNYQLPVQQKTFFSFSATGHHQNSFYGNRPYLATQKILFGQLVRYSVIGNHDLLTGLAARAQYYDDNTTATKDTLTQANIPERYIIPGIFIQDEWKFKTRHRLLAGLRLDRHKAHGFIFTPRFAYQWKPSEQQTLRFNAGSGFRVVNIFTEEHAALTGARQVVIQESLKPEKSFNLNANYSIRLGSGNNVWSLDFTAWYAYFTNKIIPDYDSDPNLIIYHNLNGYALSKGIGINAEASLFSRLKGWAGITLQNLSKHETIAGHTTTVRPVLTESWSGTWSMTYSWPKSGFRVDYTGNIYGPMRLPLLSASDPRSAFAPVWSIQNIQLARNLNSEVEFFAGIKNLLNWTPARKNPFIIARADDPFDKRVEYDASGQVKATADNPYALTFDPSYIYAPNQGLRIFAGLSIKLN